MWLPQRATREYHVKTWTPIGAGPVHRGMMRLANIADVHGNSWALEAVLDAISEEATDLTVDLGDTVYHGREDRAHAIRTGFAL